MPSSRVRVVRVRLDAEPGDAAAFAALLARRLPELPELAGGRCQVGEVSRSYPNRRGSGARRYFEVYLWGDLPADAPRS